MRLSMISAAVRTRMLRGVVGLGIVIATVLRIVAAFDEFWLDEIWSLMAFVRIPHTYCEIFTFHHDNNHYLVTLWMDVVGGGARNWFVYRIPSIVASVGTVILAAVIARRWGRVAAACASWFCATSFVMNVYGSEARGYALAGFFSLAAFLFLERFLQRPNVWASLAFSLATMLGALSHLTFIQFYCGALACSIVSFAMSEATWKRALFRLVQLHALPISFFLALYLVDVRAMRIGGGDPYRVGDVVASSLALAVGCFSEQPVIVIGAALIAAAAAVASLVLLHHEKSHLWLLCTVGFVVAPAVLLSVKPPPLLYVRYFYLNLIFLQILFSFLVARTVEFGRLGKYVAVIGVALVLAGNAKLTADFLAVGRGHYLDALEYVNEHTPGSTIRLAGDDDFDNTTYLGFYVDYLPKGHVFEYTNFHKPASPGAPPPDWLLVHNQQRPFRPAPTLTASGEDYVLVQKYPCGRLSGYQFALYQRVQMSGRR
ncbi:MAG TPA: hypothetical protein VGN12_29140 [Pirellulales bacterium]